MITLSDCAEGIIFDLDGTLIDSRKDIVNAANYVRQEMGYVPLPFDKIISFVGDGLMKMLERSLEKENPGEEAVRMYKDFYSGHLLDNTRPYPGVMKVLDSLSGKKLGVLTNKPYEFSVCILEGLGMKKHFEAVFGGGSTPFLKPDMRFMKVIMEKLGTDGSRTIMVGDHYTDIQVGAESGAKTVFAEYGFGQRRGLVPDFCIHRIEELLTIVGEGVVTE